MSLRLPMRTRHELPLFSEPGMVGISARRLDVVLGDTTILHAVDLEARHGEVLALVGPNGAGKSTLLGALAGDVAPAAGEVTLAGRPLRSWSSTEAAMRRAVLLQQVTVSFPFTVREVVTMGRAPWAGTPEELNDAAAVAAAMEAADVAHLTERSVLSLSGGERSLTGLARVLAQGSDVLLLDEPTASLDIHHEEQVLSIARRRASGGAAVVVVMHDLGAAAAHADRVAVVSGGRLLAVGRPPAVMTEELLTEVYRCPIEVVAHPRTGALLVLPRRDQPGSLPTAPDERSW